MTIDEFKKKIAPYLKKGWVAMSSLRFWYYFPQKPKLMKEDGFWWGDDKQTSLDIFDIEPVDNWQESLIEVGND